MDIWRHRKNIAAGVCCVILAAALLIIYTDVYKEFPGYSNTLTIGVFSDSYWEVQNGYSYRILEDAVSAFEKQYPDIEITYTSGILKTDYSEWLAEQMLSGSAPDVFFVLSEDFNDFAEIGVLKDLTSLIKEDKEFHEENFYSSAYAYGRYNGAQYSLPYECAPKLMFLNKTILDREGLTIPDEEWTWDEFYEICEKATKDTDQNGVLDQFGSVGYTWEEAFESNGVRLFDQKGTRCYLTDDHVEEALVFMEKLENLHQGYQVTAKDFDMGHVLFHPMLFSEYRAYKPYPLSIKKYKGFEWDCIPMPSGPEGDNISTLDTLLVAMNANTKNVRPAWDFMKILTSDVQIQSEIFDYSEGVSVLKEVTGSDQTLQRLMESSGDNKSMNLQILSDAVEHAVVAPRFRNYDGAIAEVNKAVRWILDGNSNISMGQIIGSRTVNQYLERQKYEKDMDY
ncbi:MAG: extracellular solute-binding protein [Eubacterium sp.]|nr:extracellular solute-binding protein [Eubacterium sp.]